MKIVFAGAIAILLVAVALIFIGKEVQGPPVIEDHFDDGSAGWTTIQDAELRHVQEGGKPGGYLSGSDLQTIMTTWFWEAPSKYLGGKSDYAGKSLTFDLMQSLLSNQFRAQDVWLLGPNSLALVIRIPEYARKHMDVLRRPLGRRRRLAEGRTRWQCSRDNG